MYHAITILPPYPLPPDGILHTLGGKGYGGKIINV
jgi:hypothetical protein